MKRSLIAMLLFTFLLGICYPFFVFLIGQLLFHKEANGTLLHRNGKIIGSHWIGQNFTSSHYFHPRPSKAGDKGYDAANSAGSNLGPTSQKLIDAVKNRIEAYRIENHLPSNAPLPIDAVTASGSGLDPHISLENALLQLPRVAAARGLAEDRVKQLILAHTFPSFLGFIGEKRVHVLELNLALDALK